MLFVRAGRSLSCVRGRSVFVDSPGVVRILKIEVLFHVYIELDLFRLHTRAETHLKSGLPLRLDVLLTIPSRAEKEEAT